jgi:hypothetical protein
MDIPAGIATSTSPIFACPSPLNGAKISALANSPSYLEEGVMVARNSRSVAFVFLVALLPIGAAFAGGRTVGGLGGGVGAAGFGSAAVGGGASRVGGGPTAGAVGGGSPGAGDPAGNGAAGTGNPSLNGSGIGTLGNGSNAPGIPTATTRSSDFGSGMGTPVAPAAKEYPGGISPEALKTQSSPDNQKQEAPAGESGGMPSPSGGNEPDAKPTVLVARPCGVAAHETDGFTTCIGVSSKRQR